MKRKDTTLNECNEMRTAESEPGVFFFFLFFFFFNSLKEMGKEGTVRADAIRGAFLSLETNRAFSQRNLHLPWEFTASQQKFGKHFHLKDSSSSQTGLRSLKSQHKFSSFLQASRPQNHRFHLK